MPPFHGKDTVVWLGGRDVTGHMRMADSSHNQDVLDTTVFGEQARTFIPGLSDATVSLEGLFDHDGDPDLQHLHELSDSFVWSIGRGSNVESGLCVNTGLVRGGTAGDLVTVSFDMQCTEAIADHGRSILAGGKILYNGTVTGADGNGVAVDLGATTDDLVLALQIESPSAASGGTMHVQTAAASNFASSANVFTLDAAAIDTQGGELHESSTNTQRYVRIRWDGVTTTLKVFAALHVL